MLNDAITKMGEFRDGKIAVVYRAIREAASARGHPEEWLLIIFGGRVPDVVEGTPEHLAVNTIFNRYNEVSLKLADNPQAYRPMFMNHEGRLIVSDWAAGFMLIVAKRTDAWTKILLTDTRKALAPILVSHELGVGFLLDFSKAEIDKLRAIAHYYVADAVVGLREACALQRTAATQITSQPESRQVRRAARRRRAV
jgi:hypothetical protein